MGKRGGPGVRLFTDAEKVAGEPGHLRDLRPGCAHGRQDLKAYSRSMPRRSANRARLRVTDAYEALGDPCRTVAPGLGKPG